MQTVHQRKASLRLCRRGMAKKGVDVMVVSVYYKYWEGRLPACLAIRQNPQK